MGELRVQFTNQSLQRLETCEFDKDGFLIKNK